MMTAVPTGKFNHVKDIIKRISFDRYFDDIRPGTQSLFKHIFKVMRGMIKIMHGDDGLFLQMTGQGQRLF